MRWDGIVGFHRLRRSAKRKNVLPSQPDAPITNVSWLIVFGNNDTHCWGEPTRMLTLQARCQRVDIRRAQLDARAPTAIIAEPTTMSDVFFPQRTQLRMGLTNLYSLAPELVEGPQRARCAIIRRRQWLYGAGSNASCSFTLYPSFPAV